MEGEWAVIDKAKVIVQDASEVSDDVAGVFPSEANDLGVNGLLLRCC
jgi:hypothetical protein